MFFARNQRLQFRLQHVNISNINSQPSQNIRPDNKPDDPANVKAGAIF
jgi:hypothetical protein